MDGEKREVIVVGGWAVGLSAKSYNLKSIRQHNKWIEPMRTFMTLAASALSATAALAHDMATGPHGGQVIEDAGHHVEFTTQDTQVVLFLTEASDAPLATKGATGRVIVQEGTAQSMADLTAAEPNQLTAKLAAPVKPGTKFVVSIKLADGHDVKARFVAK